MLFWFLREEVKQEPLSSGAAIGREPTKPMRSMGEGVEEEVREHWGGGSWEDTGKVLPYVGLGEGRACVELRTGGGQDSSVTRVR